MADDDPDFPLSPSRRERHHIPSASLLTPVQSWSTSVHYSRYHDLRPMVPTAGGFALIKLGSSSRVKAQEANRPPVTSNTDASSTSALSTPLPNTKAVTPIPPSSFGIHNRGTASWEKSHPTERCMCCPYHSHHKMDAILTQKQNEIIIQSVDNDEDYEVEETKEECGTFHGGNFTESSSSPTIFDNRLDALSIPSQSCSSPDSDIQNQPLASLSLQSLQTAAIRSGVPVSICKLLVVGNAKCGKTSVIRRFVQGNFQNAYISTVGADYLKRDVILKDGRPVRLQLWDIAGQDRFVHLTRVYFARAKGVLVVCDLTREKTFEAVRSWKLEIDEWARTEGREGGIPVVLIANKCDMLTDAADSFVAGANMASMCHEQKFASWYVTSAKLGSNVETAFLDLVERAMDKKEVLDIEKKGSFGFKLSAADVEGTTTNAEKARWTIC